MAMDAQYLFRWLKRVIERATAPYDPGQMFIFLQDDLSCGKALVINLPHLMNNKIVIPLLDILMTMTEQEALQTIEMLVVRTIRNTPALPIGDNIVLSEN